MVFVIIVFAFAALVASDIVQTTEGPVEGYVSNGVRIWTGIPFAAPPVGENRFRPPQPVTPWTNVRPCLEEGNICPQLELEGFLLLGNEDCLTLDVYVPETNSTDLLPVMVWIYGGGFTFGDKHEFGLYNPTSFVKKQPHIHVAMNYRLGVLGFLALKELQDETTEKTTGNYALQDQIAALKWVQRNIKYFGGDSQQVTIFGESAGAFSVCWHLVSPASAGLFRAAIMESGSCDSSTFFVEFEKAVAFGEDYVSMLGCAKSNPSETLSCIRSLSTSKVMYMDFSSPPSSASPLYPLMSWGTTIDKSSVGLIDLPINLLSSGKFNHVPVILGTNQNEGSIFVVVMDLIVPGVYFPITQNGAILALKHFFNESTVEKILEIYDTEPSYESLLMDVLRDYFFACSARRTARALYGNSVPAYLYHFTFDPHWIDVNILGEYHASEIEFVFDNPWPPLVHVYDQKGQAMANSMGTYWGNLARYLTPNGSNSTTTDIRVGVDVPYWPKWDTMQQYLIRLDMPIMTEQDYLAGVCTFWDTIQT